jgi:hypothetical protein
MTADPQQDTLRHAGRVICRVLLRRNIVIRRRDRAARRRRPGGASGRCALLAAAPDPACSSCQLRAAVLMPTRATGSFGAGDTFVNGTSSASSARLKVLQQELTAFNAW